MMRSSPSWKGMNSMERLTWNKTTGEWGVGDYNVSHLPGPAYNAVKKLVKYEDTGLQPDEVANLVHKGLPAMLDRLMAYEKAGLEPPTATALAKLAEYESSGLTPVGATIMADHEDPKGVVTDEDLSFFECPRCRGEIVNPGDAPTYCCWCGQALDWDRPMSIADAGDCQLSPDELCDEVCGSGCEECPYRTMYEWDHEGLL